MIGKRATRTRLKRRWTQVLRKGELFVRLVAPVMFLQNDTQVSVNKYRYHILTTPKNNKSTFFILFRTLFWMDFVYLCKYCMRLFYLPRFKSHWEKNKIFIIYLCIYIFPYYFLYIIVAYISFYLIFTCDSIWSINNRKSLEVSLG